MYIDLNWIWVLLTMAAVWFWNRYESNKAYSEGIQYAIYMHSQGKCEYEVYEDEDGDDILSIKFKDG